MEILQLIFHNLLAQLSKLVLWVTVWVFAINSAEFRDFSKLSYFLNVLNLSHLATRETTLTFTMWCSTSLVVDRYGAKTCSKQIFCRRLSENFLFSFFLFKNARKFEKQSVHSRKSKTSS